MKITFELGDTKVSVEENYETLSEALCLVAQVLRGAGYHFDGEIVVEDPDDFGFTDECKADAYGKEIETEEIGGYNGKEATQG